jgi:DNA polymerase-3 subunit alpha
MAKIEDLVARALQYNMSGIALTDHGSMYGIKEFLDYVKKLQTKTEEKIAKLSDELKYDGLSDEKRNEILQQIQKQENYLEKVKKFKPIVGFEAYCAARTLYDKDKDYKIYSEKKQREIIVDSLNYHLILLAKNKTGYKNLCKLCSKAWVDGEYYHPRIDKNILKEHREGLIVSSACLGGEIPQLILNEKFKEAEECVLWFKSIFEDDFYLEVQLHKSSRPEIDNETFLRQQQVNEKIIELARKTETKIIATNDIHFVDVEHAEAHERLVCLSTGKKMSDAKRLAYTKEEYLKTEEQMREIFAFMPEAIDNTIEVFDKIDTYSLDSAPIMPKFPIPESFGTEEIYRQKFTEQDLYGEFTKTTDGKHLDEEKAMKKLNDLGGYEKIYRIKFESDYLRHLTYKGAKKRFAEITDEISQRIDFELDTIKLMGFPGYFLIVFDFVAAAKEMDVWVGPGRGSAAGSAVAYCLEITNINPFEYDLLFERFLNPDRISMPDIDIDFDDDGRAQILEWVTNKYGKESVAHIITFGAMAAKSSVADVGRVQDVPLNEVNELKKIMGDKIPDYAADAKTKELPKFNVKNCLKYNKELKKACQNNGTFSEIMRYASQLEGTVRQTGIHACGIIIGSDDLTNYVPLATAKEKIKGKTDREVLVTQYDGHFVENIGLIKMDFLGLKTLSIIKEAVANIKKSRGNVPFGDINKIPLNDKDTYDIYSQGKTIGIFQFESPGMQKYLRELQPSNIGDLIAMNALYRPGPMDYIPDFIARKHGRKKVEYDIPIMEKYLKETYGITVYQEQVMLLSRLLANFTPGEADSLRKAMGKKIKGMLAELKPKFIEGGIKNGYRQEILEKIWQDWEKFASYAFNKSHSVCYSLLSYQTAYLKAHFPAEFMAANLTRNKDNITDVNKFMEECKAMKISVKGPDVNESELLFMVNKRGEIRFGLGGVKNVGEAAVESIVQERKANGNYTSIYDFLERVDFKACNKKTIEALVLSGSFDCFKELSREDYFVAETTIDDLIAYGKRFVKAKTGMKNSLFENDDNEIIIPKPEIRPAPVWDKLHKLNLERELIGIYLSEHPLDDYRSAIEYGCTHTLNELKNFSDNAKAVIQNTNNIIPNNSKYSCSFVVGGVIVDSKIAVSKTNRQYGVFTLEDYSDQMEFRIFGKDFEINRQFLVKNLFVVIKGRIEPSIQIDKMTGAEIKRINENIASIQNLAQEAPNMVKNLNVVTCLDDIDKLLTEELSSVFEENTGKIDVNFTIYDRANNHSVNLQKKNKGVELSDKLLRTLKNLANENKIKFSVNDKTYRNAAALIDIEDEMIVDEMLDYDD